MYEKDYENKNTMSETLDVVCCVCVCVKTVTFCESHRNSVCMREIVCVLREGLCVKMRMHECVYIRKKRLYM